MFKKFEGSFPYIVDQFMFLPEFCKENSTEQYRENLDKDLDRTAYASNRHSAKEVKSRLQNISHLYNESEKKLIDPKKPLSFTQGCIDGGVITENALMVAYAERVPHAKDQETLHDTLRFAYIDDSEDPGKNCAFSISYLRDDNGLDINGLDILDTKRKRPFVMTIIRDTTHTPNERETISIISSSLIENNSVHVKKNNESTTHGVSELTTHDFQKVLKTALNSKFVYELLQGLVQEDSVSLPHFLELKQRIILGKNVDDRDYRMEKLQEYIEVARPLLTEDSVLKRIEWDMVHNPHCFKLSVFEDTLQTLFKTIHYQANALEDKSLANQCVLKNQLACFVLMLELEASLLSPVNHPKLSAALKEHAGKIRHLLSNPPFEGNFQDLVAETRKAIQQQTKEKSERYQEEKPLIEKLFGKLELLTRVNQSFWQRHRRPLIIAIAASLILLSLTLLLTGVLAPLGMTLAAAGTAQAVTLGVAATNGIVLVASGSKIAWDEKQFAAEMNSNTIASKLTDTPELLRSSSQRMAVDLGVNPTKGIEQIPRSHSDTNAQNERKNRVSSPRQADDFEHPTLEEDRALKQHVP